MLTYKQWNVLRKDDWKNAPINPTCGVMLSSKPVSFCEEPTVAAYPAMGTGWMPLCQKHAAKHPEAFKTDELIKAGEKWE